jgi:hypothetical protein
MLAGDQGATDRLGPVLAVDPPKRRARQQAVGAVADQLALSAVLPQVRRRTLDASAG